MHKLVGLWDSPFVRRVAITMRLYDMPFEPVFYSVYRNVDELKEINPLLTVPSLVLPSGELLINSDAILDYLDEQYGRHRALIDQAGETRRQVLNIAAQTTVACDKVGQLFRELEWRPAALHHQPAIDRFRTQIAQCCDLLEERLGSKEWFVGNRMTHADIMVAIMVKFVQYYHAKLQCFPNQALPNLIALSQRCEAMEAFKATPLE